MRLLVDKITDVSRDYTLTLSVDELNRLLSLSDLGSLATFVEEAKIDYRLSRLDRRVFLAGELNSQLAMQCGRCLTALEAPLEESFEVVLNIFEEEDSADSELELDDDQINSILLVNGEIDLLPILQEQLLLTLPMHSLCDDNCSGLCHYCGVDLNKAKCTCEPRHFNNRFGKLQGLKLDPS